MTRNYNLLNEQLKLAAIMAFMAGMVNVASFLAFYVFSSNVTGYYAILGAEIAEVNVYQVIIVFAWILLYLSGAFVSGLIVSYFETKNRILKYSVPIFLEILCLAIVGYYGMNHYAETLKETEILVALLLFAMGIQNGFTSGITKFAVKTTHLTGATTDLGVLLALLTNRQNRLDEAIVGKTKLLGLTAISYLSGSVFSGILYFQIGLNVLYFTCFVLSIYLATNLYRVYKFYYKKQTGYFGIPIEDNGSFRL